MADFEKANIVQTDMTYKLRQNTQKTNTCICLYSSKRLMRSTARDTAFGSPETVTKRLFSVPATNSPLEKD